MIPYDRIVPEFGHLQILDSNTRFEESSSEYLLPRPPLSMPYTRRSFPRPPLSMPYTGRSRFNMVLRECEICFSQVPLSGMSRRRSFEATVCDNCVDQGGICHGCLSYESPAVLASIPPTTDKSNGGNGPSIAYMQPPITDQSNGGGGPSIAYMQLQGEIDSDFGQAPTRGSSYKYQIKFRPFSVPIVADPMNSNIPEMPRHLREKSNKINEKVKRNKLDCMEVDEFFTMRNTLTMSFRESQNMGLKEMIAVIVQVMKQFEHNSASRESFMKAEVFEYLTPDFQAAWFQDQAVYDVVAEANDLNDLLAPTVFKGNDSTPGCANDLDDFSEQYGSLRALSDCSALSSVGLTNKTARVLEILLELTGLKMETNVLELKKKMDYMELK